MSGKEATSKKGNIVPLVCRILGIIFIAAVIATALPLTIPKGLGYQVFNVESGSMYPELPVGSVIYVKTVPPEEIEEGDIITFEKEGVFVTHRVVTNNRVEGEFVTKGDANEDVDINNVTYPAVLGKVVMHIPFLGRLLVVYSTTIGRIYVILVAACGVMLNALGSLLKKK